MIGSCSFDGGNNLTAITLHPVIIGGDEGLKDRLLERRLVPHLATGKSAERILRRFSQQSASLGVDIVVEGDIGVVRLESRTSGSEVMRDRFAI